MKAQTRKKSGSSTHRTGRVNTWLLLKLLLGVTSLGIVVYFTHDYMVERNARHLYDRSVQLLAEADEQDAEAKSGSTEKQDELLKAAAKKRTEAVRHLGQFLQLEPDHFEAWDLYATTSDKTIHDVRRRRTVYERYTGALRKLETALENGEYGSESDGEQIQKRKETVQKLRRKVIEVAMEQGVQQFNPAITEIEILRKDFPNDADLFLRQGYCLQNMKKQNDWQKAAAENFDLAIIHGPELIDGYLAMMQLVDKHSREFDFRDYDPSGLENPSSQDVVDNLAEAMVKKGRPEYKAYLTRAIYRQQLRDQTEDEQRQDELLQGAVKDAEESVKLLDAALQQGSGDGTEKNVVKDDIAPLLAASNVYAVYAKAARDAGEAELASQRIKQARKYAELAYQRHPSDLRCYLQLAQLESNLQNQKLSKDRDFSAAIDFLTQGLKQVRDPNQPATPLEIELRLSLVDTMLNAGYWKEAEDGNPESKAKNQQLRDAYIALQERNVLADHIAFYKALELTLRGQWHEASLAWEALQIPLAGNPKLSLRLNTMLSFCYGNMGEYGKQLNALQRAKNISALSLPVRFALAETLTKLGRFQEASEELKLTNLRIPGVAKTIGILHIKQEFEKPRKQRNWKQVSKRLEQILAHLKEIDRQDSLDWTAIKTNQVQVLTYEADAIAEQNPTEAQQILARAETMLKQAMAQQPDESKYWVELTNLRFLLARFAGDEAAVRLAQLQAIKTLDEAEEKLGDRLDFRRVRARALAMIYQKDAEIVETLAKIAALNDTPLPQDDDVQEEVDIQRQQANLWNAIAFASLQLVTNSENLELKQQATDQARRFITKIIESQPYNLTSKLFLIRLATKQAELDMGKAQKLALAIKQIEAKPPEEQNTNVLKELNAQFRNLSQQLIDGFADLEKMVADIRKYEGQDGPHGNSSEAIRLIIKYQFENMIQQTEVVTDSPVADKADLDRAYELLKSARERLPQLGTIASTLGFVESLRGNEVAAIDYYLQAIDEGDFSSGTLNQVIPLLAARNRNETISDITERIRQRDPRMLSEPLSSETETGIGEIGVEAMMNSGQFEEAIGLLNEITGDQNNDFNYHLRVGKINLERARRNQSVKTAEDIEPHLRKATELAPETPYTWMSLVGYLLESGQIVEAEQAVVDAATKMSSKNQNFILATLYQALGKNQEAAKEFENALKEDPQNYRVLGEVMGFYRRTGKPELAEEKLKAALSRDGQDPLLQSVAANFYANTINLGTDREQQIERRKLALVYLNKILDKSETLNPEEIKSARRRKALLIGATSLYLQSQDALQLIDVNLELKRDIRDLRAKAEILSKQSTFQSNAQLVKLLEEIDSRGQLVPRERFQLARLYEITDDWKNARKHLLILIEGSVEQATFLTEYINGLFRQGELLDAENEIAILTNLDPGSMKLALMQAQLANAQGNKDAAADVLNRYLENHVVPVYDRASRLELRKAIEKSTESIDQLLTLFQEFVESIDEPEAREALSKAKKFHQEQKTNLARNEIARYLLQVDFNIALYVDRMQAVANLLEKVGANESAEKLYRQFVEISQQPASEIALVAFLGRQGRIAEALVLCDTLWDKTDPVKVAGASVGLVRLGIASPDDLNRVNSRLEHAVAENPSSEELLLQLASLRDYQRRDAEAEKIYRGILNQNPQHLLANNNLAWLLAMRDSSDLNEALELIETAIQTRGPLSQFLDTRATIYLKMGEKQQNKQAIKQAVADLNEAVLATNDKKAILVNLAKAYLADGNFTEAKRAMLKARREGLTEADLHPRDIEEYHELLSQLGMNQDVD